MLILLTLAVAAAVQPGPARWTHTAPVAHGSGQVTATYIARPVVATRQIGTSMGSRMSTERCVWTAEIGVERQLGDGSRALASTKTFKGSRHGSCAINRDAIDREIAAKAPEINAHLMTVAEHDQRELRSEIKTLTPPAGR